MNDQLKTPVLALEPAQPDENQECAVTTETETPAELDENLTPSASCVRCATLEDAAKLVSETKWLWRSWLPLGHGAEE